MKKRMAMVLCVALMACCLPVHAEQTAETTMLPGLVRVEDGLYSYWQSQYLIVHYGIALTDNLPIYTPASPQPMNVYMVTHPDCQVGINRDGMYLVSEKGLVDSITKYLDEWQEEIVAQSAGAIQFVNDPDDADIVLSVCQRYEYAGKYTGGVEGYSSRIAFEARKLTSPYKNVRLTDMNRAANKETVSGGGNFWKHPPELEGSQALKAFVTQMLSWYGFGAKMGDEGETVKALQQALADRGLLDGKIDGVFRAVTQDALETFQQAKGLETTGIVDVTTLLALYFDAE
ncbi:MAG: peptidoglycan-binding protein [Oscillospiraceae bacterium]|jgi:hypothetical protein|nr:peptidoglycan-binding protein [Oscillospiraceae bacterium]